MQLAYCSGTTQGYVMSSKKDAVKITASGLSKAACMSFPNSITQQSQMKDKHRVVVMSMNSNSTS